MRTFLVRALPLAALVSANAQAAEGWGQSLTIISFIPTENGITINVTDNSGNPMACAVPTWLLVNATDPNYALISSTILTAFAQSKTVKVWQDSCRSDGSVHFRAAWIDR